MKKTLLDKSMEEDLTNLFNNTEIVKAKVINDTGCFDCVSTKGLPQHFVGNRDAKTVFVMLNPGEDSIIADSKFKEQTQNYDWTSKESLLKSFVNDKKNFEDSGIVIPDDFLSNDESKLLATKSVLNDKLQLELIPYCSRKFNINKINTAACMNELKKYIDILLDEIFSKNRKYIIFGAGQFVDIFEGYNKYFDRKFEFIHPIGKVKLNSKNGYFWIIKILYKNQERYALITNTFPAQHLPMAYELMLEYGTACYNAYKCFLNNS